MREKIDLNDIPAHARTDEILMAAVAALDKAHDLLSFVVRYDGKCTPEFVALCQEWIDGEYSPHGEADHEAQANAEIVGDVRRWAKEVTGGNCSFADDDIKVLAVLAKWAILDGCPDEIAPNILPKARHHLNGGKGR